jgi:hypothetical protein
VWLLLEGPEGAGKLNFAKVIANRMTERTGKGAKVFHTAVPDSPETALAQCYADWKAYRPNGPFHLVSCGLHWKTAVYGSIFRKAFDRDGYGEITRAGWRLIEMGLTAMGGVTIGVSAPDEVLAVRSKDFPTDPASLDAITAGFTRMATESSSYLGVIAVTYAMSHEQMVEAADMLINAAMASEAYAVHRGLDHGYIGALTPGMVVGVEALRVWEALHLVEAAGPFWSALGIVERPQMEKELIMDKPMFSYTIGFNHGDSVVLSEPHELADRLDG